MVEVAVAVAAAVAVELSDNEEILRLLVQVLLVLLLLVLLVLLLLVVLVLLPVVLPVVLPALLLLVGISISSRCLCGDSSGEVGMVMVVVEYVCVYVFGCYSAAVLQ